MSDFVLNYTQCLNCEKLDGGVELFDSRRPNKIMM